MADSKEDLEQGREAMLQLWEDRTYICTPNAFEFRVGKIGHAASTCRCKRRQSERQGSRGSPQGRTQWVDTDTTKSQTTDHWFAYIASVHTGVHKYLHWIQQCICKWMSDQCCSLISSCFISSLPCSFPFLPSLHSHSTIIQVHTCTSTLYLADHCCVCHHNPGRSWQEHNTSPFEEELHMYAWWIYKYLHRLFVDIMLYCTCTCTCTVCKQISWHMYVHVHGPYLGYMCSSG